ncbi:hypothetical protein ETTORE_0413 [Pseudomonas phage Ettore]|nr:hypothetical protein ETTORE_0413 [Pseudomonas phage Ettore]
MTWPSEGRIIITTQHSKPRRRNHDPDRRCQANCN